jgi:hypothetical protein
LTLDGTKVLVPQDDMPERGKQLKGISFVWLQAFTRAHDGHLMMPAVPLKASKDDTIYLVPAASIAD